MDSGRGWPPVHVKQPPLGDDAVEGWRRDGWWERVHAQGWAHGLCRVQFNRTCPAYIPAVQVGGGDYLRAPDANWTGAEIKSCCRLAALLDIPLVEAAQNVVPISVTSAEQIERLRGWAEGRCLSADNRGIYTRVGKPAVTTQRPRRVAAPAKG
jgi:hypothetical protein